jgi:hypothetical protein
MLFAIWCRRQASAALRLLLVSSVPCRLMSEKCKSIKQHQNGQFQQAQRRVIAMFFLYFLIFDAMRSA